MNASTSMDVHSEQSSLMKIHLIWNSDLDLDENALNQMNNVLI